MQPDVRAANPEIAPQGIMGIIAGMWQNLNEADKQVPFVSMTLLNFVYLIER